MPRPKTPDLDLSSLYEMSVEQPKMTKEASSFRLKFAEHQTRFARIGFDLYRDNDSEFIWKLEKDSETGDEFIIRTAAKDPAFKARKGWTSVASSGNASITLAYNGHAIKAFKKAELEYDDNNVDEWRRFLVDKITTDPQFLNKVLTQVGESRRKHILGKFPELK